MYEDPKFMMEEAQRHMRAFEKEADNYRTATGSRGGQSAWLAHSLSRLSQALASIWDLIVCSWDGGARRFPARCA